ncbi:helix-turn-helix domain-containing protein [Thalassospira sp. HF15]|uniref:helix-turn-helix domain-containing protein n=1 Tax=Thalassospira sp. HF15 TaxID=2722755 RepID=UPI001430C081|nr:helix-turn-helix domain-containing protein [Thalassospira sp. HF15]NIY77780.1 helix-turn-helix domain-containing protein [Thalassospira sp. HF15]
MTHQSDRKSAILERSRFSLRGLPSAQQFEIWKESINCIYSVDADRKTRQDGFVANLDSWRHRDLMMVEAQSCSQSFSRTSQMIAADGMDHYNVQLYTDGGVKSDRGVGGDILKRGGLLLLDLAQPTEAQASDQFSSLHLFLPRHLVEEHLSNPEDHNLRFLSERDPLVKMLFQQILSMHRYIDQLDDAQITVLQKSIVMILATCLNAAEGNTPGTQALRRDIEKSVRVRRYFRENLLSPELTAETAADDLGMSRSALYRLFQKHGGVKQYLRDMRLRHALTLLGDRSGHSRSIYDIALECGYETDAGFIRAFRAKYEVTPGDVRAGASPNLGKVDEGELDKRYEHWLHTLS